MDITTPDQIPANYLGWSKKSFIPNYEGTQVRQTYEEDKRKRGNEYTELFPGAGNPDITQETEEKFYQNFKFIFSEM